MAYVVKATFRGSPNTIITERMRKEKAMIVAKKLKLDMSKSIPKYKWAKNIQVIKVKRD